MTSFNSTPQKKARAAGSKWRPKRLMRDEHGVTAVEFALVATPFFILMFGILEIGFSFFMNRVLDNAVSEAARVIRTGQAHQQGFNAEKFKAEIFKHLGGLPFSENRLDIDVETIVNFGDYDPEPLIKNGELNSDFGYDHGEADSIVIVEVMYRWPMVTSYLQTSFADLDSGDRLLASTEIFKNEPFPWKSKTATGGGS